jgi:hypothetical protein
MAHPDLSIRKSFAAARHQGCPRPVQFVVSVVDKNRQPIHGEVSLVCTATCTPTTDYQCQSTVQKQNIK